MTNSFSVEDAYEHSKSLLLCVVFKSEIIFSGIFGWKMNVKLLLIVEVSGW